ncbi:subtilisin family serine protease [Orenia metallireducens]|uniref:Serine protease, subtilisin family n=1 Tax=Orenia metallireducens TaxID=1413210 RepID=A0A285IB33_9FIRM|nr:S8/S53 family peptidase [Orenia metallireducens]PRX21226.1 subtilisin family serine protease [Orenia metallireducens]SNY44997.1 Serine protease, subtilisin family [Orenia metallireducens]
MQKKKVILLLISLVMLLTSCSSSGGSGSKDQSNAKPIINEVMGFLEEIDLGESLSLEIIATDADNDKLSYAFVIAKGEGDIVANGNKAKVTPSQVGELAVKIMVEDGKDNTIKTVTTNVNAPPFDIELNGTVKEAMVGDNIEIEVLSDTNNLSYEYYVVKGEGEITSNDNKAIITPKSIGDLEVKVVASNGSGEASKSFVMKVFGEVNVVGNIGFELPNMERLENPKTQYSAGKFNYPFPLVQIGVDNLREYNQYMLDNLETIRVGVIDSGVNYEHPYLSKVNVELSKKFRQDYYGDEDILDMNYHGTAMTGLIGADFNSDNNFVGVAPNVELVALKTSDTSYDTANALDFVVDNNIDIVNMSFIHVYFNEQLQNSVQNASVNGVIMNSAIGNQGVNDAGYPAKYDETFAIGGIDRFYNYADTNYCDKVDFVVAGSSYLSTHHDLREGELYTITGESSGATAIFTGITALIKGKYPNISQSEMKELLKRYSFDLGTKGYDEQFGWGMPHLYTLMNKVLDKEVKVFVAKKDNNNLEVLGNPKNYSLSVFTNLSNQINYEFNFVSDAPNHSVFAWIDVNEDGQINAGDYLGESSNGDLKIDVTKQDYNLM